MKKSSKAKTASKTVTKAVSKSASYVEAKKNADYDPLNTVTPLSKILAIVVFVTMSIFAFFLGMNYQQSVTQLENATKDYESYVKKPMPVVTTSPTDVMVSPSVKK